MGNGGAAACFAAFFFVVAVGFFDGFVVDAVVLVEFIVFSDADGVFHEFGDISKGNPLSANFECFTFFFGLFEAVLDHGGGLGVLVYQMIDAGKGEEKITDKQPEGHDKSEENFEDNTAFGFGGFWGCVFILHLGTYFTRKWPGWQVRKGGHFFIGPIKKPC